MTEIDEITVPLIEAENEVKVVTQRLALLHLAYANTLIEKFGWKKGKQLVINAIKEYGRRVAERKSRGHQDLPKYGFWERRKGKPNICEFGKIVIENDEMDIGSLYCLVDPAKTIYADPAKKLVHLKALTVGDEYCEFSVESTSEADREYFFDEDSDWSFVDPRLHEFYKEIEDSRKNKQ